MFSSLGEFLSGRYECRRLLISSGGRREGYNVSALLWDNIRNLKHVLWADTVVVHVASAPAVLLLSAGRLFGKRVVLFQWDIYPTTIAGVRYKDKPVHRILYRAERVCLALASLTVLPSDDFLAYAKGKKTVVLPLWPQSSPRLSPVQPKPLKGGTLDIAFAGQVNPLRGLAECVAHLAVINPHPINLHVFSSDRLPVDFAVPPSIQIQQHGSLPREELQLRLTEMHFGLVSLHPLMDQPGFPSKTFDYVTAGLPVLYFGRPLPAYSSLLEEFGIGIDITNRMKLDLSIAYQKISSGFEAGRTKYIAYTNLDWEKIAGIC